jgi:hypothetical protein
MGSRDLQFFSSSRALRLARLRLAEEGNIVEAFLIFHLERKLRFEKSDDQ